MKPQQQQKMTTTTESAGDIEDSRRSARLSSLDEDVVMKSQILENVVTEVVSPTAEDSTADIPAVIKAIKLFELLYTKTILDTDCFDAASEQAYKFSGEKVRKSDEIIVKSSNDLYISQENKLWHLVLAIFINGFQIALLYYASLISIVPYSDLESDYRNQLYILLIPFCSAIIAYNLVTDFDRKLKKVVSRYFHHENPVTANESYDFFRVVLSVMALPFVSIFTLLFRFRTGLIMMINQAVAAMLINAIAKMIRSQTTYQGVLFNFVGIMGILQLDNIVAEMFSITLKHTVIQYQHHEDKMKYKQMTKVYEAKFTRITFLYYFVLTMIVMYSL